MKNNQSSKQTIDIVQVKSWFEGSSDITVKQRNYKEKNATCSLEFFFCPNLVDIKSLNEIIFPQINMVIEKHGSFTIELLSKIMEVSQLKEGKNIKAELEKKLFSGELLIYCYDVNDFLSIPKAVLDCNRLHRF